MFHEINGIRNFCRGPLIFRVNPFPQGALNQFRQGFALFPCPEKDLCSMIGGIGEGILMDADDYRIFRSLNEGHPVLKVGNFFLAQGLTAGIVDRHITVSYEDGGDSVESQQLVQTKDHRQIDVALCYSGKGYRSPVLPAMSCV